MHFTSTLLWLILAVVLAALEISTTALVCIWFVIGSLFAFAVSFITDNFLIQAAVFIAVSGVSLALTRPLAAKFLLPTPQRTNSDMLIGKTGEVVEPIGENSKGRVKIDGLTWLAESETPLPIGTKCVIERIVGATLVVSAKTTVKQ
ncbi:MAG: NfeD family protein [Oscillospiraceae bacterium]